MRQALRRNPSRRQVSRTVPVLAPTKGLITALDLSDLPDGSAIVLDNWFPDLDTVRARRGSAVFANGIGAPVETLMGYQSGITEKLFAAGNGKIWDVTSGLPVATTVTGLTSTRLQHTNFATSGGQFLYTLNGFDAPRVYDGTAWAAPTFTFGAGVSAITPSLLVSATPYKGRLFFAAKGSTTVYYLPVDTFQGELLTLETGGEWQRGGYVQAIGRWTTDSGEGPGDYLAVFSSEGEVLIYQGTDPSDVNAWSLQGRYTLARPIGRRCLVQAGADLGVLTVDGLLSISRIMSLDIADQATKGAFTGNIATTFHRAVERYGSGFGWEVATYPDRQMLIVNVPTIAGSYAEQYAMNLTTGAWCHWTGMNALCWETFQGKVFFGTGSGMVAQADTGMSDLGQPITAAMVTAFQPYGSRTQQKIVKLCRAILKATTNVQPGVGVCTDYNVVLPISSPGVIPSTAALWGVAKWGIDVWSGDDEASIRKVWANASAVGSVFAAAMTYTSDPTQSDAATDLRVIGFDMVLEPGGVL